MREVDEEARIEEKETNFVLALMEKPTDPFQKVQWSRSLLGTGGFNGTEIKEIFSLLNAGQATALFHGKKADLAAIREDFVLSLYRATKIIRAVQ